MTVSDAGTRGLCRVPMSLLPDSVEPHVLREGASGIQYLTGHVGANDT